MHLDEYERMARVEDDHWWYRGLRDVLARTLKGSNLRLPDEPSVLDAGCGTGANLGLLRQLLRPSYLGGFDTSEEALRLARTKVDEADIYPGDICDPEIRTESLDLVVSMDVVYIPGVERSLGGLRRLVDRLRPGGLFVVNLPAYDWLYSEHDIVIHTSERYTAGRVRSLMSGLGLEIERLSYRVFLLFPAVVLTRLPGMMRVRRDRAVARSDLTRVPARAVNEILFRTLRLENSWIARGRSFPWGSSVFAAGRKR
jgi:SAM-dependent methyltransferase